MKTIKIKNLSVREVILQPDSDTPLSVLYALKDDAGNVILNKRIVVKKENMEMQAEAAILTLINRITSRITDLEEIN